jgi:hypothetical protein
VKTFCCECSTIVEQAKTQLRVVEPIEGEEVGFIVKKFVMMHCHMNVKILC